MATKTKSRAKPTKISKASKSAKPIKLAKQKIIKLQPLTVNEVVDLERQVSAQKHSERSWQDMTSPTGDDKWGAVEENLVQKPNARAHSERRWKYYSK